MHHGKNISGGDSNNTSKHEHTSGKPGIWLKEAYSHTSLWTDHNVDVEPPPSGYTKLPWWLHGQALVLHIVRSATDSYHVFSCGNMALFLSNIGTRDFDGRVQRAARPLPSDRLRRYPWTVS